MISKNQNFDMYKISKLKTHTIMISLRNGSGERIRTADTRIMIPLL